MSQIYEYGCLNLSALRALDSHSGLFSPRKKEVAIQIPTAMSSCSGCSHTVKIRPRSETLERAVEMSELDSRGWVFQERILAQAVLHFGHGMMFWECKCSRASEAHPNPPVSRHEPLKNLLSEAFREESLVDYAQGHYLVWYVLLETYSQKQFTNASDKLPAILGLAKRFERTFKAMFVAGLWYEDLHRGLLWSRYELLGGHKKGRIARTPSWSWISTDFALAYTFELNEGDRWKKFPVRRVELPSDMELLDAKVNKSNTKSRTKEVRGLLELQGIIARVTYKPVNLFPLPSGSGFLTRNRYPSKVQLQRTLDFDCETQENVFCLRVASWEHCCHREVSLQQLAYFLVLERSAPLPRHRHPSNQGEFRRVGIGADEPEKVDEFFGSATKQFLTLA